MFETSVVRARAQAAGGRLSLLTISIIAHSAVIVGAVTVSLASVDFPTMAPDEYRTAPMFAAVTLPPPLGTPQGNNRPVQQPVQKQQATPPVTKEVTAPTTVPETVTPVDAPTTTLAEGTDTPGDGTGPRGVEGGDPHSIETNLDLPTVVIPGPQAGKIYEAYEVKAPVLVQRVDPPYPPILVRTGVSATVVVRCIIDKNGRVRDPQVTVPARFGAFNDAVINAVQKWRYTPGSLNGEAVETYLNVTVHFSVTR